MISQAPAGTSDRLILVVESFLIAPSQTLSEVAASCGIELATATRYLRRLVEHGWLEREESTRCYSLGVKVISLGQAARELRPMRMRLLPYMHETLDRFGETVNLAVHQGDDVVIVEALESTRSIRSGASVGERDDWFVSSLGKAILAHLPRSDVQALLDARPPVPLTPHTLLTPEAIFADLEAIRGRGYSLDDQEAELGMKCVGVPIGDPRRRVSYALSVAGPADRINAHLDDIIAGLREVSNDFAGTPGKVGSR